MITSVAELLEGLLAREAALLADEPIVHRPTIGDMFEGLTKDVLSRAIPQSLGLQLVDGFVEGHDGTLSPQTDLMLVMGDRGRPVPYTAQYIWPIQDVLAVFEIKKVLYANELIDGLTKMARIWEMQRAALQAQALPDRPLDASARAFARVMGRHPHQAELADFDGAGGELFRTIAAEQLAPVRIIYGYEGYVGEHGLREAVYDYLEARIGTEIGPAVLPSLIVCRTNSVIKTLGHPYTVPLEDDGWFALLGSERKQPWRLLIELIWTRLSNQFGKAFPMDDTLDIEAIAKLLQGKPIQQDGQRGWILRFTPISADHLSEIATERWEPVELNEHEEVVLKVAMQTGGLDLSDDDLNAYAAKEGFDPQRVAQSLVDSRLFAWTGSTSAEPITDTIHTVNTPDGKVFASLNADLLGLWVESKFGKANG